jgi:hypothetical protein
VVFFVGVGGGGGGGGVGGAAAAAAAVAAIVVVVVVVTCVVALGGVLTPVALRSLLQHKGSGRPTGSSDAW